MLVRTDQISREEKKRKNAYLTKFRKGKDDEKEIALKFDKEASLTVGKSPLFKPSSLGAVERI